jgi:hypothetical protein
LGYGWFGIGGIATIEEQHKSYGKGPKRISTILYTYDYNNMAAGI